MIVINQEYAPIYIGDFQSNFIKITPNKKIIGSWFSSPAFGSAVPLKGNTTLKRVE